MGAEVKRLFSMLIVLHAATVVHLAPSWHDNMALWSRVLAVSPTHAMAALNVGAGYSLQQDPLRAEVMFETARELAKGSHVHPQTRALVTSIADQDLVIIAEHRQPPNFALAGDRLREAYDVWPESFTRPGR